MHMIVKAIFCGITAACLALPVHAQTPVGADQIVKALTTRPKAIMDRAGKWTQPDPSLDLQVTFDFNKADLTPAGQAQLDQLAFAFQNPALAQSRFLVAGHTDKVGNADYNLRLSRERAAAVKAYLQGRHGIAEGRIQTEGHGFTRLADPTNPGSAVNRRVEIRHLLTANSYGAAPMPAIPAPMPVPGPGVPPSAIPVPGNGGQIISNPLGARP